VVSYKIEYIERGFGMNETIEAVIKHVNKNENLSGAMLSILVGRFNRLNGLDIPTTGKLYKIPLIQQEEEK